jgi:cytosine/adenosine deaminase-related metal-dependent hydrolase
MAETACIRDIDWLVAWNRDEGRHAFRHDCNLAFAGNAVAFVGGRFAGPADTEIDGRRLMAMVGLVDIHGHSSNQPPYKGVREDLSNPYSLGSAL